MTRYFQDNVLGEIRSYALRYTVNWSLVRRLHAREVKRGIGRRITMVESRNRVVLRHAPGGRSIRNPTPSNRLRFLLCDCVSSSREECLGKNVAHSYTYTLYLCRKRTGQFERLDATKNRKEIFPNLPSQKTLRIRWLVRVFVSSVRTSIAKGRYRTHISFFLSALLPPPSSPSNHHHPPSRPRQLRQLRLNLDMARTKVCTSSNYADSAQNN